MEEEYLLSLGRIDAYFGLSESNTTRITHSNTLYFTQPWVSYGYINFLFNCISIACQPPRQGAFFRFHIHRTCQKDKFKYMADY